MFSQRQLTKTRCVSCNRQFLRYTNNVCINEEKQTGRAEQNHICTNTDRLKVVR
jgi:hypothetical protein